MLNFVYKNAKKIKPYLLTFLFGGGKVISTIGSSFFALDKIIVKIGGDKDSNYNIAIRIVTAVSGGISIALTRLPEMWKAYSNQSEDAHTQIAQTPENKKALILCYVFGAMGYISAIFTALAAYLGGNALAKIIIDNKVVIKLIGAYASLSSFFSFTIYSVKKVINSSYTFGVLITESRDQISLIPSIGTIFTGITTGVCMASSATMFYFSVKNSLPLFLKDITGEDYIEETTLRPLRFMSGNPVITEEHLNILLTKVTNCGNELLDNLYNNLGYREAV